MRLLLLIILACVGSEVVATEVDPSSFFGGNDNQAYLDWLENVNYTSYQFITTSADPDAGAAIHWRISRDKQYLNLAIAVRATGWVGFGISEPGGMLGADMMIFEARNPTTVIDAYVKEERYPLPDDCQDWQLIDSRVGSNFLIVAVRRKLDTGDTQDWAIINDSSFNVPVTRIISAWGDAEQYSYHGQNLARGTVRWFNKLGDETTVFNAVMDELANGTFFVGPKDYKIKAIETDYQQFCINADDLRAMGVPLDIGATLIGFDPRITSPYVHHFNVYGSESEGRNTTCTAALYTDTISLWAPGYPPVTFPRHAGMALGGENGYRSFRIEIHYNNPQLVDGAVDSSGMVLYWTHTIRENQIGVLSLGDTALRLIFRPVGQGLTGHRFVCPGNCSSLALDSPVTVLREVYHMHTSGVSAYMNIIRNGSIVHHGAAQYFEFSQQGQQLLVQKPYQIMPGDSFDMKFFYRNSDNSRRFGYMSEQEMCFIFLFYYPRKRIEIPSGNVAWTCGFSLPTPGMEVCEASYEGGSASDEDLERSFGEPSAECGL